MEIKFRAKRSYDKKWIHGNLVVDCNNQKHIIPFDEIEPDGHHLMINSDEPMFYEQDTFGQLWNPSNGLFCYEGDLFEAECSPQQGMKCKKRIVKISRDGKGMTVVIWYNNEWWSYSSMKYTTFKYLGNIWDNSELINGVS